MIVANARLNAQNTVGSLTQQPVTPHMLLAAGDAVACYTADASTTGTVGFVISVKLTVFDP